MAAKMKYFLVALLPLLLTGCVFMMIGDLIVHTIKVPCVPAMMPTINPAEPLLPGEACLRLPANEAAWVNRSEIQTLNGTTFAEVQLGEITRKSALHVLKSSFARGATETPGPGSDRVDVYAKVDQYSLSFGSLLVGSNGKPIGFGSFSQYYWLQLSLTVRFTTPDGRPVWEHTYDSSYHPSGDIAKMAYELQPVKDEPSRLFQEVIVDLMQSAVRDYGKTLSAQPAANDSAPVSKT